jgi:hypothetical protein
MARMTFKGVLLIGVPIGAALIVAVAYLVHDSGASREARLRERAELDKHLKSVQAPADAPDVSFKNFRQAFATSPQLTTVSAKTARSEVLKHGDKSIPYIQRAIQDSAEAGTFRLEAVGLLGEMQSPLAESELLALLANRAMEDRFRMTALRRLEGRPSEAVFAALKRIYTEEAQFSGRYLVLKAIGASNLPESTAILIGAVRNEAAPSARIQAIDSLGSRMTDPAAFGAVREALYRDSEENVRLASLASLCRSADPAVNDILKQLWDDPQTTPALKKAVSSWKDRLKGN